MEIDLRGLWIGPMPVRVFVDEFMPPSKDSRPVPEVPLDAIQNLSHIEDRMTLFELVSGLFHITARSLIKTLRLRSSSAQVCPQVCSLLPTPIIKKTTGNSSPTCPHISNVPQPSTTQSEAEELIFALKPSLAAAYPFEDPVSNATAEELLDNHFETNTDTGILCGGQIALYFTQWFAHQHRTRGFLLYITNNGMRFIRADRFGVIVSRLFYWRQEPQIFAKFLWLFAHLMPGQRGHDTTVGPAMPREKGMAHLNPRPWEPKNEKTIIVLWIPEGNLGQGGFREVIAMADADLLTGRATRAWPVYDLKLQKIAFFKDSWRYLVPVTAKESLLLNEADV